MDNKITIIEGPPPVFEPVQDGWALSLSEGPTAFVNALTRLRTFNGAKLVERCYRAWNEKMPMHLVYRTDVGLEQEAPIHAARVVDTDDGDVLLLWVYLDPNMVEFEFDNSSDEDSFDDEF